MNIPPTDASRVRAILALVSLLAAPIHAMELGPELLPNHDFAQSDGERPARWAAMTHGQAAFDYARQGVVHFRTIDRTDYVWLSCKPNAPVKADAYYCVRARAKLHNAAPDAGRVLVEFESADRKVRRYRYPLRLSGTCDFTDFQALIKAPIGSARISLVRIGVYRAVGEAWFDWVSVRQPSVAAGRLMPNKDSWRLAPRPVERTDVVDIGEALRPADFWRRFPEPPRTAPVPADKLFDVPLLRGHYFGLDFAFPVRMLTRERNMPHAVGKLGQLVPDPKVYSVIIAEDIPFRPIMRNYRLLSDVYYPRRMHRWAGGYLTSYLMTDSAWFLGRGLDMANFILYSQYGPNGENAWLRDFYPDYYAKVLRNGMAKQWAGGYDYLFDFEWPDGYGYRWPLHAPDHHVNSGIAMWMVRTFNITGQRRFLDSARRFITTQMPRYGFHAGTWQGQRYYWSEYNPSGPGNPTQDATDNIQALLAQTAAAVGYYDRDPRLLECARGLVWYMCREWQRDGRWYYHGMENPLDHSRGISHDVPSTDCTIAALPYLLAAGVDVAPALPFIGEAVRFYFTERGAPTEYFRGYLLFGKNELVCFVQVTGLGAADVKLAMALPKGFDVAKRASLVVSDLGGAELFRTPVTRDALAQGVPLKLPLRWGDIYRIQLAVRMPKDMAFGRKDLDPFAPRPERLGFKRPRLLFADEFGDAQQVELAVQSPETLGVVTPANFADFRAKLAFPRPALRRAPPTETQP